MRVRRPGEDVAEADFTLFDAKEGTGTLISVTNTNTSTISCGNRYQAGDVCLHYIYVNKVEEEDGEERCYEFDRFECLTPGDTLTVDAEEHNPQQEQGWLWVEARDPETLKPITFDYLIGSAVIVDSVKQYAWGYTPYSFRSLVTSCTADGAGTDCGAAGRRCFTDLNEDQYADFGIEYEAFPEDLLLDHFFEEGKIDNELTLMSTRTDGDTALTAFIWNNEERRISRGFVFTCHSRAPLNKISEIVTDLGGTEDEEVKGTQSGWIEFNTTEGVLGVFKYKKGTFGAGKELFGEGTKNVSIRRY